LRSGTNRKTNLAAHSRREGQPRRRSAAALLSSIGQTCRLPAAAAAKLQACAPASKIRGINLVQDFPPEQPLQSAPFPDNESSRLAALAGSALLDTPTERVFDALTQAAAAICNTPIAFVSLVDQQRQWFKSALGPAQGDETSRDIAFCAHAIVTPERLMEVPDAVRDGRFHDNPLVTGDPGIPFYAGAPLLTGDGHALGTLCVIDRLPRQLDDTQLHALAELAHVATAVIDARRLQVQTARRQHELYNDTPAMLYCLDGEGRLVEASRQWLEKLGYTREQVIGRNPRAFMSAPAREEFLRVKDRYWAAGGCRDHPCQFVRCDGRVIDVLMSAIVERAPDGRAPRALCVLTDVTEQLRLQRELQRLAHLDSLTGVCNRGRFVEQLGIELQRSRRHARPFSLVLFDIDHFKQVNDSFGHAAGDAVLRRLADVVQGQLRSSDVLGRLGGEEFGLLLPETGLDAAIRVAERFREAIESLQIFQDDRRICVTVSVGVTTQMPDDTGDRILARADEAMYEGKRGSRNKTVAWHSRGLLNSSESRAAVQTNRAR